MKKVSLLLFTALASLSISAQSIDAEQANPNGNWFVGAGASATMYLGPTDQHASLFDRMTVNPQIMVGKWFNPYLGARLAAQAGKVHTFTGNDAQNMFSMTQLNAHADLMVNVTNLLAGYNGEERFYNFIPTVGIGYGRRDADGAFFKGRGFNGPTFNASLLNTFKITDKLSAFVELGGYLVESRFDKGKGTADQPVTEKTSNWNGIINGTAGLMLKFGRQGFPQPAEQDLAEIARLNSDINRLQSENAELRKRPVSCPPVQNCPDVVTTKPVVEQNFIPNVVFFKIGQAVIEANQQIGVYNTAEYLKANPNAKVKIVGYADKDTGTAAYNLKLSEKRAKNVANELISKYGISKDRVTTEWKGSSEQPYKENAWNRVAIFFAE